MDEQLTQPNETQELPRCDREECECAHEQDVDG